MTAKIKICEVDSIDAFKAFLQIYFAGKKVALLSLNLLVVTENGTTILKLKWCDNPHIACRVMLYDAKGLFGCRGQISTVQELEEYLVSID